MRLATVLSLLAIYATDTFAQLISTAASNDSNVAGYYGAQLAWGSNSMTQSLLLSSFASSTVATLQVSLSTY